MTFFLFVLDKGYSFMATNNLFNVPSWRSIQELFFRRLGIALDPTLVTYAFAAGHVTITANPTAADGSKNPYQGTVTLPLDRLQVSSALPSVLVWSDLFPMTVDALAGYLLKNYGYYLEDGEFFVVGDPSSTPLVRGGGPIYNGLNVQTRQFSLRATPNAVRWNPGSTVLFQLAAANSIVPADGFALTSGAPPGGNYAQGYSYTYTVTGGTPPYRYSVLEGTSVAPINPSTGVMSTPSLSTIGSASWIVQVADSVGRIVTRQDTVAVTVPPLAMTPVSFNPVVAVGVPVNVSLGVTGGEPPYAYSVYLNTLPSGVTFQDGAIVGTFEGSLTQTQSSMVVGVQVVDTVGTTIQRLLTFTINDRAVPDIQTALCAKVLHWFEYSADIYGYGLSPVGTVIYDATGRANLQVAAIPSTEVANPGIYLASVGRSNQSYGFSFGLGGYLHNNTTAYTLPTNFSLMAMVNFPTYTPAVATGQKLISRGADAFGGYDLAVGADGTSLALDVVVAGVPSALPFPSQIPHANGTWYHVITQLYDGIPEMEINAGSTIVLAPVVGSVMPNSHEVLCLGIDPGLNAATAFDGGVGMVAVFKDKVWSDERKWLYNGGSLQAFQALGFWSAATASINTPLTTIPLGVPFTRTVVLAGGSGVYVKAGWLSGSQVPPGLSVSYDGANTITVSGTPTTVGTYSFEIGATSTDGQTAAMSFSNVAVVGDGLALSGQATPWTVGTAYSYTYTATAGVPPYTWSLVSGTLPAGLTLNAATGTFSGTPTALNAPAWTVRVADSGGTFVTLRDNVALQLVGDFAALTEGVAYTSDIAILGGDLPYSNLRVDVGVVPNGLSLALVSGKLQLNGTPTDSSGTDSFTVAVDSADGQTATSAQSLEVTGTGFSTAQRVALRQKLLVWYEMDAANYDSVNINNYDLTAPTDSTRFLGNRTAITSRPAVRTAAGGQNDWDTGQYSRSNYTGLRGLATYSIRLWYKTASTVSERVILEHGQNPAPESGSGSDNNINMKYYVDTDGAPKISWQYGTNQWTAPIAAASPMDTTGAIHYLGVDRDDVNHQVRHMRDGVQEATAAYAVSPDGGAGSNTYPFIGGIPDSGYNGYNQVAGIQTVMLFNAPLTASEDEWLYNNGVGQDFATLDAAG